MPGPRGLDGPGPAPGRGRIVGPGGVRRVGRVGGLALAYFLRDEVPRQALHTPFRGRTLNAIALAIVNGTPPFAPQPRRWSTIDELEVRHVPGRHGDLAALGLRLGERAEVDLRTAVVQGRVALAGDAAHLNSPVGGQGMNAGIQDSEVLCRCLLQALAEDDPRALESYERERRESIEQGVNRFSDRLTRLFLAGGGRFLRPMLRLVRAALAVPPLRRRLLRRLTMLDGPRR